MKINNKRFLFFDFVTHYGGAQNSTATLCRQLAKENNVYIIDAYGCCKSYLDALPVDNVFILMPGAKQTTIGHRGVVVKRIQSLFKQLFSLFKLQRKLVRQIERLHPDLIWTNSIKSFFFLSSSWSLRHYPLVFYARGWYRKDQVSWLGRWMIKYRVDSILAVSHQTADAIEAWGVHKNKIHVAYTSIDFEHLVKNQHTQTSHALPAIDKHFKILVPGALIKTKGQHTAIKAAAVLKQQGFDFVMWLAGDSTEKNGAYLHYLEQLISENDLRENVFFLGWRHDMPFLLQLSSVVILPSHTEGLPRIVQEAMFLKRPVIATPVGGTLDLIRDGITGLLVPVDDHHILAEKIKQLALDPNLTHVLGEKAHSYINENFQPQRQRHLVLKGFEWAIDNKRRYHVNLELQKDFEC